MSKSEWLRGLQSENKLSPPPLPLKLSLSADSEASRQKLQNELRARFADEANGAKKDLASLVEASLFNGRLNLATSFETLFPALSETLGKQTPGTVG